MRCKTVFLAIIALCGSACTTLPEASEQTATAALGPERAGPLASAADAVMKNQSTDKTAMLLLENNKEALEWRLALIDSAVGSLDMQYFLWNGDAAGALLMDRLIAAADRGVRLRVLLDDLHLLAQSGAREKDWSYAAISAHPNIEMKIFNPGKYRDGTLGIAGSFMGSFDEFNRRMHNKLIVADGQIALAGGRNLGNEYFGLSSGYNFLDLDVMFTGAAVAQASAGFDEYWNNKHAYPTSAMAPATLDDLAGVADSNRTLLLEHTATLESFSLEPRDWSAELATLPERMHIGQAEFVQDIPDADKGTMRLYEMLSPDDAAGAVDRIVVVTAYLIPRPDMIETLKADIAAGSEVILLTNSLASNNHTAASSQYAKFREDMLEAGASLYEFKHQPSAEARGISDVAPVTAEFIGLHMKAFSISDDACYVGSLNLDPRAIDINTENGLVIYSTELCSELNQFMEILMYPENAWHVTADADGNLTWTSDEGSLSKEPVRAGSQRLAEWVFRQLPIQDQL